MHKTLVSYDPTDLGHSSARKLWQEGAPENRRVSTDREAHVVLYDEVHTAVRGFSEDPTVLRIVVSATTPRNLPKGIFWIKPDIQAFTNLIRTLNPGE